jgi:glucokinase
MYVGLDVGGTKVLAVETDADGVVVGWAQRSTRGDHGTAQELEDAMTTAVAEVAGGRPLSGVGVSTAGLVDVDADLVRFCTHLPWRHDPVRARLAERWQTRVVMENDATCAAVAEQAYGAAHGIDSFLLVTIGTGIGGAIVHDGRVLRGAGGMAGEFGHMRVQSDGRRCECGLSGCWEQYCSGNVLPRLTAAERPELVDGPAVTAAARAADPVACAAFKQVGEWLGVGVACLVAAFDPAMVVVGGGVSAAGDLLLDPAREAMIRSTYAATHRHLPPLVPAMLGPRAGAIGAAYLARTTGNSRKAG